MSMMSTVDPAAGSPAGHSLDKLCHGPMELTTFLHLAVQITGALARMHQSGLIHKNIKPQNISIDGEEVKLTDLRLAARSRREQTPARGPTVAEGTLAYMSPEQTGRMNRWIDERSDLYSLGVTFYEMLVGELPFAVKDALEWVHCHIARVPQRPAARLPRIPAPVSELVMKLLAKAPEDRYQSAQGLRVDLVICLDRLLSTGRIEPFPLGARDVPARLQIPQRLYGRRAEIEDLLAAFARVAARGTPELVIVSGYSGIGKSSLVRELQKPIVVERGFFLSGKFDQYQRNVPYSTVVQALRQLVLEILTASEEEVSAVRQALKAALGPNGQVITTLVPEVELIIGKQPPVPELSSGDAQNRQHLVFRQFLGVFARKERPIALFLDDLQWADAASLKLLMHLAAHAETRHLLLIGAYRDNEVNPTHPLILALDDVRKAGAVVREIVLGPLAAEHLGGLVADSLHRSPEEVADLTRLISERTGGNPFFAIQFLMRLHEEQLVTFDAGASTWRWDLAKIGAKGFTDNVVDLLVEKLKRLSAETQRVLELAACLGNRFSPEVLTVISGRTEEEARQSLWEAVKEGLVLPGPDAYRFLHDRVQQAAYSLIGDEERSLVHLRIGRLLLADTPPERMDGRLFDIVGQLNLAAACITDPGERRRLAALNGEAGKRAKASSAWHSAARFLSQGIDLLASDVWESDFDLAYALHLELIECEYLSSRYEEAERLMLLLLEKARSPAAKAEIYRMKVDLHFTQGDPRKATDTGIEGLALFGIDLPPHPTREQVQEEYDEVQRRLGGRPIEALLDLPLMTDPDMKAAMRILGVLWAPAIGTDANLTDLHLGRMVNICLRHGNTDASTMGYAWWGVTLLNTFHQFQDGYRFGALSRALMEKHGYLAYEAKVNYSLELIATWVRPIEEAIAFAKAGFLAGVERGDLTVACFCCNHITSLSLTQGGPLKDVYEESERRLGFARTVRFQEIVIIIACVQRYIQNMRGLTRSFSSFSDDQVDEAAFEASVTSVRMAPIVFWYWILKMQAKFMSGDLGEALSFAKKAEELLWCSPPAHIQIHDYHLYFALVLAAMVEEAPPEERRDYERRLEGHRAQLEEWAASTPRTFLSTSSLVSAEIARIRGDVIEAGALYEQAIRAAREGGFLQNEALANELAARFYLGRGLDTTARGHLREAHAGYIRWGAHGKRRQLEQRYPEILAPQPLAPNAIFAATSEQIDLLTVMKASQSISSEIVLPRLVETLIRIVIEAAGAQEGYLIRSQGDDFVIDVEAHVGREGGAIEVIQRGGESASALPGSIFNYVKRTRERLLLDDATADPRFSADVYIARRRPRSVVCLPLVRQAELVGLLYIENNLMTGAFTPDRLTVLELLTSQASISLENATLYLNLSQENAERRRAEAEVRKLNEELELRVLDRTAQLSAANSELEAFSSSVSHDLRGPLRNINGFSQALAEDYGDSLDDEAKSYLAHIRAASQRMGTLIDDMINLSRVTRSAMERSLVDLSALAREVMAEIQKEDASRDVTLVVAEGLSANGDERLLRIALHNLLGNAWKFTGKHPRARIELGKERVEDGGAAFFVRDDGAGFDMSMAAKMFTAFERLHTTSDFPGTGIGLATVKRVIERHGGRVWAESAVEKGATFYFTV